MLQTWQVSSHALGQLPANRSFFFFSRTHRGYCFDNVIFCSAQKQELKMYDPFTADTVTQLTRSRLASQCTSSSRHPPARTSLRPYPPPSQPPSRPTPPNHQSNHLPPLRPKLQAHTREKTRGCILYPAAFPQSLPWPGTESPGPYYRRASEKLVTVPTASNNLRRTEREGGRGGFGFRRRADAMRQGAKNRRNVKR